MWAIPAPTATPPHAPRLGAQIHDVAGPAIFLALFGACVAVAAKFNGWLATYSVVTAIVGLGLTVWTALAHQRGCHPHRDCRLSGVAGLAGARRWERYVVRR